MIVEIVCDVEVLKLNHEEIVWQIIPDYLVGLALRAPDWLRYLSGQVIPSREVV